MQVLTKLQVDEFKSNGILVIPSVLNAEEIEEAKENMNSCLENYGYFASNPLQTAQNLAKLSSTNGSGGVLDIFYEDWKLKLNEHPSVVKSIQELWSETYAFSHSDTADNELYSHPFGPFNANEGYMYVDRICYRVPSSLSSSASKKKQLQRPLGPHLDCCPHNMHKGRKWRPIQAFIALTDTLEPDQGGFEACPGMHRDFRAWTESRPGSFAPSSSSNSTSDGSSSEMSETPNNDVTASLVGPPPCVGDFTPIRPVEDKSVIDRFQHIPCRAGDMVCWDYRIPHANARLNTLSTPRQVVYIGLLPAVPLNRAYALDQLERYKRGVLPIDQWHSQKGLQKCDYPFSALGRRLMAIDDWQQSDTAAGEKKKESRQQDSQT